MRLYFAGLYSIKGEGKECDILRSMGMNYKLYSYHNEPKKATEWGTKGLMLDSGAFTAWSKGVEININEFIKFVQQVQPEHTIQLDVIGDEDATWKNWLYLNDHIDTMPVIHYNASRQHIKRVMESSDYICLGGLVPLTKRKKKLYQWLDYIFTFPQARYIKIHCLGVIMQEILLRYPFYSADSSSALSIVRYPIEHVLWKYRQKTRHYTELYQYGVNIQLDLQRLVTEVWDKRLNNA